MSLTDEQKAIRRTGIGGSEIAAIAGLDPYKTALDVWLSKVEGYEQPDSPAMERGRFLEAGVAAWYSYRTGALTRETGTIRHPKNPLVICTPDRLAKHTDGTEMDLSIKVPGPYVRESWGEQWSDDVPLPYVLQLQWELSVLGALGTCSVERAHLAAPIDGDLRIYLIHGDVELQGQLHEEGERFWRDYVVTKRPPPLDGSDSSSAWIERRFPKNTGPLLQADPEIEVLAVELEEACRAAVAAAEREAAATNRLKERIGAAAGVEGAFGRVTWRANKNGVRSFKVPKHWRVA